MIIDYFWSDTQFNKIYSFWKNNENNNNTFFDWSKPSLDHIIPVSKGGTNDFSNVFCSCHICNTIKHDIYPEDFMERISKIFLYQMEKKSGNSIKWKIIHRLLNGMV